MKRNYFNNVILAVFVAALCSCENFFENKRPQETQWTTTATFEQGLSTCYWIIQWSDVGRGNQQFLDFCTSGTAAMMKGTTPGLQGDILFYRKFDERIDRNTNNWKDAYRVVTMCNLAIDLDKNGNGNPFNLDTKGDDYRYNYTRQVADYYFCRAWAYWILIKTFADPYIQGGDNSTETIPLKTTAAYSQEDVLKEKLGTREEVYQQIISDLKYAKQNLPDKITRYSWSDVAGYEAGRANKWVAAAILGKVYFLMGKYAEAKAEFDDLINYAESTKTYTLEEAPKEAFNKEKAQDYPKESIWEFNGGYLQGTSERHNNYMYYGMEMGLRFRDSQGDELLNSPVTGVGTVISTWRGFGVAFTALKEMNWMVDPMNGNYTITAEAESDLRYRQVYHMLLPYTGKPIPKGAEGYLTYESNSGFSQMDIPYVYIDKFFRGTQPYGRNSKFPFVRLADIYLLRSWLNWKNNSLQAAVDDLNKVWNRSNPSSPNKYTIANVNHQSIYAEYLKEMTGEGWTVDFLMGTHTSIPKGDSPLNSAINPPYTGWSWPIPSTEESLNPNYLNIN